MTSKPVHQIKFVSIMKTTTTTMMITMVWPARVNGSAYWLHRNPAARLRHGHCQRDGHTHREPGPHTYEWVRCHIKTGRSTPKNQLRFLEVDNGAGCFMSCHYHRLWKTSRKCKQSLKLDAFYCDGNKSFSLIWQDLKPRPPEARICSNLTCYHLHNPEWQKKLFDPRQRHRVEHAWC